MVGLFFNAPPPIKKFTHLFACDVADLICIEEQDIT